MSTFRGLVHTGGTKPITGCVQEVNPKTAISAATITLFIFSSDERIRCNKVQEQAKLGTNPLNLS